MTIIKSFSDGGKVVEANGVQITTTGRHEVIRLSDWTRATELVAAGVLRRNVWRGNGMYGHDTFTLIG